MLSITGCSPGNPWSGYGCHPGKLLSMCGGSTGGFVPGGNTIGCDGNGGNALSMYGGNQIG